MLCCVRYYQPLTKSSESNSAVTLRSLSTHCCIMVAVSRIVSIDVLIRREGSRMSRLIFPANLSVFSNSSSIFTFSRMEVMISSMSSAISNAFSRSPAVLTMAICEAASMASLITAALAPKFPALSSKRCVGPSSAFDTRFRWIIRTALDALGGVRYSSDWNVFPISNIAFLKSSAAAPQPSNATSASAICSSQPSSSSATCSTFLVGFASSITGVRTGVLSGWSAIDSATFFNRVARRLTPRRYALEFSSSSRNSVQSSCWSPLKIRIISSSDIGSRVTSVYIIGSINS